MQSVFLRVSASPRQLFISGDSGDSLSYHERMNVVRSLVCLDGLEVAEVTHDRIFVRNSVGAEQVARNPGAIERDGDVVALEHGDMRGFQFIFILEAAGVERKSRVNSVADLR